MVGEPIDHEDVTAKGMLKRLGLIAFILMVVLLVGNAIYVAFAPCTTNRVVVTSDVDETLRVVLTTLGQPLFDGKLAPGRSIQVNFDRFEIGALGDGTYEVVATGILSNEIRSGAGGYYWEFDGSIDEFIISDDRIAHDSDGAALILWLIGSGGTFLESFIIIAADYLNCSLQRNWSGPRYIAHAPLNNR